MPHLKKTKARIIWLLVY